MDVYIHAGKIILAEFWATGCDEEVNSRMLKYKKEIDFFLPRSASDFLLLECRTPGFSVLFLSNILQNVGFLALCQTQQCPCNQT